MAVTPEDVRAIAPELAERYDEDLERWIAQAERRVNRRAWGARADDGVTFLAAHLALRASQGSKAPAGPVASVAVGDVSQSFATPAEADSYDTTFAGQQYKELLRLVFASRVM